MNINIKLPQFLKKEKTPQQTPDSQPPKIETDSISDAHSKAQLVTIVGFVMILFGVLVELGLEHFFPKEIEHKTLSYYFFCGIHLILRDGGLAAMSGGIIALILEIKNLITFTRNSVISALTSSAYLEKLTLDQVQKIKNECNNKIIEIGGNRRLENGNQSILKLENSIDEHLFKPYYDYFDLTIICKDISTDLVPELKHISPPEQIVEKIVKTKYKLVNPVMDEAVETLDHSVLMYVPETVSDKTCLSKVRQFTISIDGADKETPDNIAPTLDGKYKQHSLYSHKLDILQSGKPVTVKFKDELEVVLEEKRYVFKNDPIFTKRFNRPSKQTFVHYTYDSDSVHLRGDCFGFGGLKETKRDLDVDYLGKSVSINYSGWLLPGNGIVVAQSFVSQAFAHSAPPNGVSSTTADFNEDSVIDNTGIGVNKDL